MNLNLYNFDSAIKTIDSSAEKITEEEFDQTPTIQEKTIHLQSYTNESKLTLHIFKNHQSVLYTLKIDATEIYYKTVNKPLYKIIDNLQTYFIIYT